MVLLLPVWPRDAKRLDTPESLLDITVFAVYNALLCITHTHILVLISMYNTHPYFSLKNLGKKVLIIHDKNT